MTTRSSRLALTSCLKLAAAFFIVTGVAAPAVAAEPGAPASPLPTKWTVGEIPPGTPGLDDLDEVMVRGKRAAIMIADLEDEYYELYNKLNKDDRYDVHCLYTNTDPDNPGSSLLSRICIPGFVADAMSQWAEGRCDPPDFIALDLNKDHSLSEAEAAGSKQLLPLLWELDTNHDRRLSYVEFSANNAETPIACYQPPPPEHVLVAGTDKWYRQMMKVTTSDPRLQQMAANLGDLYGQLRVLERHAGKLEAQALKAQAAKRR